MVKRDTVIKTSFYIGGIGLLIFAVFVGLGRLQGNRDRISILPRDNVVYTRLYKNPQTNQVFVRHMIQRPPREDLQFFTLTKGRGPINWNKFYNDKINDRIKAVHLVVKGTKIDGKSTVKQISNLPMKLYKLSPHIQYYIVGAYEIMTSNNEIGNPIMEFDWISFDVELNNFPVSGTRAEQEDFLQHVIHGGITRANYKDQEHVSHDMDPEYKESFEKIASPK